MRPIRSLPVACTRVQIEAAGCATFRIRRTACLTRLVTAFVIVKLDVYSLHS